MTRHCKRFVHAVADVCLTFIMRSAPPPRPAPSAPAAAPDAADAAPASSAAPAAAAAAPASAPAMPPVSHAGNLAHSLLKRH